MVKGPTPARVQVFLTSRYLAIAMEYVPGGDMFEHVVRKGGLKESETRYQGLMRASCLSPKGPC